MCSHLAAALYGKDMVAGGELDSRFAIRPECQADVPKTHFKPKRRKTLSERRWKAALSEDGHLDIAGVLRRVQKGGVHPSIKGIVWEFLLGCFDPNSTFDERNVLRQHRREQYEAWKTECQNMVPIIGTGKFVTAPVITDDGQPIQSPSIRSDLEDNNGAMPSDDVIEDKKVILWKLVLHQIGLDVVRTDRSLFFYESESNQAKLWNILAIYAWLDDEIGYVQGMNDICSPMVILLDNEADAFWCFERAMRRLRENFRSNREYMGVQSQLHNLAVIVRTVDPKLHRHLEELDSGEYLFALRMVMVLFRRELSFVDALYLWEVMWAMEYNPTIFEFCEKSKSRSIASIDESFTSKVDKQLLKNCGTFERNTLKNNKKEQKYPLAVFLVASVLETKSKKLRKEAKGPDEVVEILGDVTARLNVKKAMNDALKIQKKYLNKVKHS